MVAPSWDMFQSNTSLDKQQNPQSSISQDEKKPEVEKPDWGNFQDPMSYQGKSDPTADESTIGYFARNAAALGSRVGEQILGRYGNVEKFAKDMLVKFPEAGGIVGWALSELIGKDKWERMVKGPPGQ